MSVFAAVMTGKGTGAISTIQIFGDSAEAVIKKIFNPAGTKAAILKPGKILVGTISDASETIDQVTIGCEGPENFAINCHGNPLIVADVMRLLQRSGATLLTAEELLTKILSAQKPTNTIALEAKLAQPKAKTVGGTKIIANQIDAGLSKKATQWLRDIDSISLDEITADAARILKNSQTAKLLIDGCIIAIVGPPNTGKSTLLNCLCGRQKAIVTDIKGTTRDWVSSWCQIGSLCAELVDTAGLDEKLAATPENTIEKTSQEKSVQILEWADLVLLVADNNQPIDQLKSQLLEKIAGKKVLTVLNKSDLPTRLEADRLPEILADKVQVSAKFGKNIEKITEKIQETCGISDFNFQAAVCFTPRQEKLLRKLVSTRTKGQVTSIITELLNGRLSV